MSTTHGAPAAAPTDKARLVRGGSIAGLGLTATFLLMANVGRAAHGPLLGAVTLLVGVVGLLDLLGFLAPQDDDVPFRSSALFARAGEPMVVAPLVAVPLSILVFLVSGVVFHGHDTALGTAISILLSLVPFVPGALHRPALLVALLATALYLPWLGSYALWDPWETHYGEVAREMLSRDDWISLWWAQENWFWSKPIFIFWSEAFSMAALGVDPSPDANPAHPAWALRLPHFFLALGALLAIFATVRRSFSARAGVLAAVVVATMPHFYLIAHQAITDMPLVANLVLAMCGLAIAIVTDPSARARSVRIGPWSFSLRSLVVGAVLFVGVAQILYLASRQLTFHPWRGFSFHPDEWAYGSAGNDGAAGGLRVPGNAEHHPESTPFPTFDRAAPTWIAIGNLLGGLWAQSIVQALQWTLLLAWLVRDLRKDQTERGAWMTFFYLFCALGFLAKGIPGFALPGLIALFYLIASGRWSLLLGGELRVARGSLVIVTLGLPWYWAMCVRHGMPFLDRILVHDHLNRLAAGVHGDNGPIDYFLGQLGYGTFPWIGLLPAAAVLHLVARRARPSDGSIDPAREVVTLVTMWALASFTLFNAMVTKFHHYILPVVPPMGMLAGIFLDRLYGRANGNARTTAATCLATIAPALLALGIAGRTGSVRGLVPKGVPSSQVDGWVLSHPVSTPVVVALVVAAVACFVAAFALLHREGVSVPQAPPDAGGAKPDAGGAALIETAPVGARGLGVALFAGAILAAFVGRDLSWVTASRPKGFERLIDLFVYKYDRPFPEHIDYRPALTGLVVTGTAAVFLLAWPRLRPLMARALVGLAIAFTVFALDVHLPDLAEHWSSHSLVRRYYASRASSDEPLIAFQMNWKGENFYTGNRAHVFQDLDTGPLRKWITDHDGKTFYVVLEHGRIRSFTSLLPVTMRATQVTDTRENNKFVLLKVDRAPIR